MVEATEIKADLQQRILVNLSWLVKLRWVASIGQLLVVLVVHLALQIKIPYAPICGVIALTVLSNLAVIGWYVNLDSKTVGNEKANATSQWLIASIMFLDLLSLTCLLYWTGGPNNPFILFYFVNLSLAGVLLHRPAAIAFQLLSSFCFSFLLFFHQPLSPALSQSDPLPPITDYQSVQLLHVGLMVAFITCNAVIVYFLTRLTDELRQQEENLREAESRQAMSEKYEALGTLAAGAAHELSTPLSTIALVSKEAELVASEIEEAEEIEEDLSLIRSEVDRCRRILDRMATGAGQVIGESFNLLTPEKIITEILAELGEKNSEAILVQLDESSCSSQVEAPPIALAQACRSLVQNALDSCTGRPSVQIQSVVDRDWTMKIVDQGTGMPPSVLSRVSEPFFTTKAPGRGMGLGVFLARSVVERLGGSLKFQSAEGKGTTVVVTIPLLQKRDQPEPKS